jgi:hypothetical protein
VSLNIRSPYRRQKRDFLIIRLSFRRPYTGIEISAIIPTTSYFSPDHIDYFLSSYLFAITLITSYFPTFLSHYRLFLTFLRPHRLFLTFLSFCDHIDYILPFYPLAATSTTFYLLAITLTQLIKTALNLPCLGIINYLTNQIRA